MTLPVPAPVVPYSPDYEWARQKGELVTVDDLAVKHRCSRQTVVNAIQAGELSAFKAAMGGDTRRGAKYYVFSDSAEGWSGPKGKQRGAMRVPLSREAAGRGGMATKAARETEAEPEPCEPSTCAACSMRVWCVGTDPAMPWRRRARVLWRAMVIAHQGGS